MLQYISLLSLLSASLFSNIYALNTNTKKICNNCKWFIANKNSKIADGYCRFFKEKYYVGGIEYEMFNYAKHCRNNENQCGQEGYLYQPAEDIVEAELIDINNIAEEEKIDEVEELEQQMNCLYDKIEKLKIKRIKTFKKIFYEYVKKFYSDE